MNEYKVEVDVLDYKQRFVERTRTFDVTAKDASRAEELVESEFDMDYVEEIRVEKGEELSNESSESVRETTKKAPRALR